MATTRYSPRAEADLSEIAVYTLEQWGEKQTDKYLAQLDDRCDFLAANPLIGRACPEVAQGLRRFPEGSHIIFYEMRPRSVLIVRILHRSRVPRPMDFK